MRRTPFTTLCWVSVCLFIYLKYLILLNSVSAGIQQYLYVNGRIDNIFYDPYYERFTECLDEVARKFSVLYNDSRKWNGIEVF